MTGQPETLWLSADIARELGIGPSVVANWASRETPRMPPPHAVTPAGLKLWNNQQVKAIIAGHHERNAQVEARNALSQEREDAKQRADRMLRILTGAA